LKYEPVGSAVNYGLATELTSADQKFVPSPYAIANWFNPKGRPLAMRIGEAY